MISKSDIKLIKSLSQKKYRQQHQLFVVEGKRLVFEVVQSDYKIKQLFITDEFFSKPQHNNLIELITEKRIKANAISDDEMKRIADTVNPSGILALCEIPSIDNPEINKHENWLYLDKIQDPGNLGTLLRSANWFGVKNIALSENCIDAYNPKVLRGGMGSHFNLKIYNDFSITNFNDSAHTLVGAFQDGKNINNIEINETEPWVLVIGNEAHGISKNIINNIDLKVTIPKLGAGESLNAAVAGSVLLYRLTKPV